MDGLMGQVQEERLVRLPDFAKPTKSLIGENIGGIAAELLLPPVDVQQRIEVGSLARKLTQWSNPGRGPSLSSPMCHLPINAVEYPDRCRYWGKNVVPSGTGRWLSTTR